MERELNNIRIDFYTADVVAFNDYYPFGMVMPGRNGGEDFRFGFQGQEKDDEVKGEGNSVNYKYRMHDPRVGRFFAVDPLTKKYPYYTPYSFSGNKVVHMVELEGLEEAAPSLKNTSHYGTPTYYLIRHMIFKNNNPGKKAPAYYLDYGYKYAKKFNGQIRKDMESIRSKIGVEFLNKGTEYLQEAIEIKLAKDPDIEYDSEKFSDFAFKSHVDVYIKAGFLELGVLEQAIVALAVDPKDLFSDRGLQQTEEMMLKLRQYQQETPGASEKMKRDIALNYKNLMGMAMKYYDDNKDFFKDSDIDYFDILDRILFTFDNAEVKTEK